VNAIAMDPSMSTDTVVANVDRKILERYILPFLGTTTAAYMDAVGQSAQEVVMGGGNTTVVTQPTLSAKQEAAKGIGAGISQFISDFRQNAGRPSASLPAGWPVGVLFLDPVFENLSSLDNVSVAGGASSGVYGQAGQQFPAQAMGGGMPGYPGVQGVQNGAGQMPQQAYPQYPQMPQGMPRDSLFFAEARHLHAKRYTRCGLEFKQWGNAINCHANHASTTVNTRACHDERKRFFQWGDEPLGIDRRKGNAQSDSVFGDDGRPLVLENDAGDNPFYRPGGTGGREDGDGAHFGAGEFGSIHDEEHNQHLGDSHDAHDHDGSHEEGEHEEGAEANEHSGAAQEEAGAAQEEAGAAKKKANPIILGAVGLIGIGVLSAVGFLGWRFVQKGPLPFGNAHRAQSPQGQMAMPATPMPAPSVGGAVPSPSAQGVGLPGQVGDHSELLSATQGSSDANGGAGGADIFGDHAAQVTAQNTSAPSSPSSAPVSSAAVSPAISAAAASSAQPQTASTSDRDNQAKSDAKSKMSGEAVAPSSVAVADESSATQVAAKTSGRKVAAKHAKAGKTSVDGAAVGNASSAVGAAIDYKQAVRSSRENTAGQ